VFEAMFDPNRRVLQHELRLIPQPAELFAAQRIVITPQRALHQADDPAKRQGDTGPVPGTGFDRARADDIEGEDRGPCVVG